MYAQPNSLMDEPWKFVAKVVSKYFPQTTSDVKKNSEDEDRDCAEPSQNLRSLDGLFSVPCLLFLTVKMYWSTQCRRTVASKILLQFL